jgi:hypothetical protein
MFQSAALVAELLAVDSKFEDNRPDKIRISTLVLVLKKFQNVSLLIYQYITAHGDMETTCHCLAC